MYLRTEFLVRTTEEALPQEQALETIKSVSWVRDAGLSDSTLTLSFDPGGINQLQLAELIKNVGYEVVSLGKMTEIIEDLDRV